MKVDCDACGFDLTDDSGYGNVALSIKLLGAAFEKERVIEIFGKNEFNICHVCRLKSLGIKPKKRDTSHRPPKKNK